MRAGVLTREYPPEVYGGAGVHVEYLVRELRRLIDVDVHCWGADREGAQAYLPWERLAGDAALATMSVDLAMTAGVEGVDLVHSHTWYANLAGHLASLRHGIPHVATVHSLEPLRPWKAEQLGGGYALSSWCEKAGLEGAGAVIAVSEGMARDVRSCYPSLERVEVIYNGIDADEYRPSAATADPPTVVYVGRITRQKGLPVLLEAARAFDPGVRLVLCAGSPDTTEIEAEVRDGVAALDNVEWIEEMIPKAEVIDLLSAATVFVCPSVYEPLGIVNLEAMACETAVVASAVGGIVEVVLDGETGLLVPPSDPAALAEAVNALVRDPARAAAMGRAGRERAVAAFDWSAIARQTAAVYESVTAGA
ncbi:MAG: alpha-maltose-phosphate synthase [Solirubrobacteraceae bacterium]|jgi:starch synthase|nr:alpha-maltose-phosphate synthase [Solirubrobacteraceae bacterium]